MYIWNTNGLGIHMGIPTITLGTFGICLSQTKIWECNNGNIIANILGNMIENNI